MPTFERTRRFRREYLALPLEQREAFKRALRGFIQALRRKPPSFQHSLRVKGVQGHPGVYELSFGARRAYAGSEAGSISIPITPATRPISRS